MEIDEKLQGELDLLNEKVNALCGYPSNDIKNNIQYLLENGYVSVGYRQSCGATDRTQKIFRLWTQAVKKLKKNGINLIEEQLKVGNAYATISGGFWQEIKYSIKSKT